MSCFTLYQEGVKPFCSFSIENWKTKGRPQTLKRTGGPIVIWRNGKVVKIPANQIEIREPVAEYKALDTKGK